MAALTVMRGREAWPGLPAPRALACSLDGAIDESHDLIEPRLVAIGGIDLHPGRLHRDPVEGGAVPREIREAMIGPGVGVRPAHQPAALAAERPVIPPTAWVRWSLQRGMTRGLPQHSNGGECPQADGCEPDDQAEPPRLTQARLE
jgi:hypothetical protein